ncbi:hypothetical protein RF11_02621 [Thelohanellus kitauei]|uniref:Peptidase A2 domain-containing protein n=1 Tax=Thelohanellus kitauei TaxID=669202 RepID=A0A0C2J561_THEKT|nr:hypothetical protein RF11_02621 [Thelohanellus kitauei]
MAGKVLIDTGSSVSLLKLQFKGPNRLSKHSVSVSGVNGRPLSVLGTVEIPFILLSIEFIVSDNIRFYMIIGRDFIFENRMNIRLADKIFTFDTSTNQISSLIHGFDIDSHLSESIRIKIMDLLAQFR